jgi:ubiquitin C-terminal hydrolase
MMRYVNGIEEDYKTELSSKTTTTTWSASVVTTLIRSLFTSNSPGDLRELMNVVASHHPQFRSRSNGFMVAGTLEQQDTHEFFTALMDVLSNEENEENEDLEGGGLARSSEDQSLDVSFGVDDTCRDDGLGLAMPRFNDYSCSTPNTNELEEEKKYDDHHIVLYKEDTPLSQASWKESKLTSNDNQFHNPTGVFDTATTTYSLTRRRTNPFDGWSGSTIKCSTCRHVRPIRAMPFLDLSLPIANVQSEFLEDFLAAEYGGFSNAELISDVRCLSCGMINRMKELEGELMILDGAISNIKRRGRKENDVDNDVEVATLVRESNALRRKIAILMASDRDIDDDEINVAEMDDEDLQLGIDQMIGSSTMSSRIVPIRGEAYKASLLMRPPEVLCIHIQRRHYDMSSGRMAKVNRHVRFDEYLDLGEYCAYGAASFEEDRRVHRVTSRYDQMQKIPYILMSVIEHSGNAFGGHYQTYRRVDQEQNDWVLVSDESVVSRTWTEVRKCQAYMLFYSSGGTPEARSPLLWSFCLTQQLLCLHVEDITRQKRNHNL